MRTVYAHVRLGDEKKRKKDMVEGDRHKKASDANSQSIQSHPIELKKGIGNNRVLLIRKKASRDM